MKIIAGLIARAIKDGSDESKAKAIKSEIHQLTKNYPVYADPVN